MDVSSCCNEIIDEADGYMYCTKCGRLISQSLETSSTSYNQSSYFMPRGYTRRSRFVKKVLGSLRLRATHKIDETLVKYLKEQNIKTPTELLGAIAKYPAKGRRPYQFSMFYWKALGFPVPRCTDQDVDLLVREFDNILFAWERFRFKRPKFPYSFLFRKLVAAGTQYSTGIKQFIPFVRKLRCQPGTQYSRPPAASGGWPPPQRSLWHAKHARLKGGRCRGEKMRASPSGWCCREVGGRGVDAPKNTIE